MTNHDSNFEEKLALLRPLNPSDNLPIKIAENAIGSVTEKLNAGETPGYSSFAVWSTLAVAVIVMLIVFTLRFVSSGESQQGLASQEIEEQQVTPSHPPAKAAADPEQFPNDGLSVLSEIRPNPFSTKGHKFIARGQIISISDDGVMTVEIDKFLSKEHSTMTTVEVPKSKWAWLKICQAGDRVYLYWGNITTMPKQARVAGQHVSLLIRCAKTAEDGVWRFHCNDWNFLEGSMDDYENKLEH